MDTLEAGLPSFARPPRVFALGVTGHRLNRIAADRLADLPKEIARLEKAVLDALADAGAGEGVLLVSSLAEGVDRIAAHAALHLDWRLAAIIPYALARYEQDFTAPGSAEEFRALLAQSEPQVVLDGAAIEAAHGAHMGYAAAGALLAASVDLVLAVWDGEPPRGPGGTADVCARALGRGKPVLWSHSERNEPAKLILPARPAANPDMLGAKVLKGLRARFPLMQQPSAMRVAD